MQVPLHFEVIRMSQPIELSLDDEGRILVPLAVRDRLGLSPGMTLVVEQGEDEDLRLRVEEGPELIDKGGVLVVTGQILEDLTDVVQRERDARAHELMRRTGR
jgi:bifunctional DNA-binding transcriptional regulator/antitoxin component of YhaV-PrlF toxin-antitoxin module